MNEDFANRKDIAIEALKAESPDWKFGVVFGD